MQTCRSSLLVRAIRTKSIHTSNNIRGQVKAHLYFGSSIKFSSRACSAVSGAWSTAKRTCRPLLMSTPIKTYNVRCLCFTMWGHMKAQVAISKLITIAEIWTHTVIQHKTITEGSVLCCQPLCGPALSHAILFTTRKPRARLRFC